MTTATALRFQSDLATRSADTRPTSWREDDLSIEAVAATETPTRMRIYERDDDYGYRGKDFDEVLDVAGLSDDEIRGFVGCPILDSHSAWSSMTVVGVIDEARREGTQLVVRFRLSKTEDAIVSKVRDGILQKVSIGYRRKNGAVITEREGDVPLRRQPFVPLELSLVAIGADPNAGTRSTTNVANLSPSPSPDTRTQEPAMNVDAFRSAMMTAFTTAMNTAFLEVSPPAPGTRAADPVDVAAQATIEGVRTLALAPPLAPVVPAAPVVLGQRSAVETAAITGLRAIAETYGKGAEFDAFAAAGEPLEGLRSKTGTWSATATVETNGQRSGSDGNRSNEQFISHDEAVLGRRSGNDAIATLTAALSQLTAR